MRALFVAVFGFQTNSTSRLCSLQTEKSRQTLFLTCVTFNALELYGHTIRHFFPSSEFLCAFLGSPPVQTYISQFSPHARQIRLTTQAFQPSGCKAYKAHARAHTQTLIRLVCQLINVFLNLSIKRLAARLCETASPVV
jgi:hypothetical protein